MAHNAGLLATVCQPEQGLAKQDQGWQTVGGAWRGSERSDRPSHAEPQPPSGRRALTALLNAVFCII
jgi:hypothetical protein